jgi:membrane-associated protease RseP (regulator of RpoE activity)
MTALEGFILFLIIFLSYFFIVFALYKKGILEKYGIRFYGPGILLIGTRKGLGFLKRISSKKRFWKAYGSFGIIFCLIVMIIVLYFFFWNFSYLASLELTPEQKANLPGIEFALVLPGINPIIPLEYIVYIIIALAIGIIVHEFSHGILAFVGNIKVKSMGLSYLIIPIGAFVEPDDEELKKIKNGKRMRVFAAGPLANFTVVLICVLLFSFIFMGGLQPVSDGVVIVTTAGENDRDSPADIYGFEKGMIIESINGTPINSYTDFFVVMNTTKAGQELEIDYFWKEHLSKKVILSDKYEEYENRSPNVNNESYRGKGYFGIYPYPHNLSLSVLKNPFGYNPTGRFYYIIALPIMGYFEGYNPLVYPFTESYEIIGPLSFMPDSVYWFIVNALYWIFWLNLMLGLFNVLPMIPLDGGYLFNDYIRVAVKKVKKEIKEEKLDKIVSNISLFVSLGILFLILFPFLLRYI